MTEHQGPERIWLEPDCCADPATGRMWCEDNVWPTGDCPDDTPAVEYIRADLAAASLAAMEKREEELIEALRPFANAADCYVYEDYSGALERARDCLTALQAKGGEADHCGIVQVNEADFTREGGEA